MSAKIIPFNYEGKAVRFNTDDWLHTTEIAQCDALAITYEAAGKKAKPYAYMNEARLVNEVITGQFAGRDRDQLSQAELELVMLVENRDVLLIGQGKNYAARKSSLNAYVQDLRTKQLRGIA